MISIWYFYHGHHSYCVKHDTYTIDKIFWRSIYKFSESTSQAIPVKKKKKTMVFFSWKSIFIAIAVFFLHKHDFVDFVYLAHKERFFFSFAIHISDPTTITAAAAATDGVNCVCAGLCYLGCGLETDFSFQLYFFRLKTSTIV